MTGARTGRPARRAARTEGSYAPFLLPGVILVVAVIAIPLAMNVATSFTEWPGVGTPTWVGLGNYETLFTDGGFWALFGHNAVLVVAMSLIPTVFGLVLAFALFDFIGRRFGPRTAAVLRACIYLPQVLPAAVAGIVWSWILTPGDGALNVFLADIGLRSMGHDWLGDPDTALYAVAGVLVWIQLGYPVIIFMAGMQRVDPGLYEAAEIDGASWPRRLWHVTVPQLRPEIFVVLATTTIASLKTFDKIYVLTHGGPGDATNVPSYASWQNFFEKSQVGYGSAIATLLTVLVLALGIVFLRAQRRAEDAQ